MFLVAISDRKYFLNLIMQVQVDIEFEQLVKIAKKLPKSQWQKLKTEVEKDKQLAGNADDLEAFLLTGPTFTKKQLEVIDENRKAINKWRTI
jgi:hypothetical protein